MPPVTTILPISDPGSLTVWCVAKRDEAALLTNTIAPLAAEPRVKHVVILHTGASRIGELLEDAQRSSG